MATFMYKVTNNLLAPKINDLPVYKTNINIHLHNTRHRHDPHIRYRRIEVASKQINHMGPFIWQKLPDLIKKSKTSKRFVKSYKNHLITNDKI